MSLTPEVRAPKIGKKRKGKGFSVKELQEAGLSIYQAKRLNIPLDLRRKTLYQENVEKIKKILEITS